jgi:glycine/D-amino acid oxidase-like deaminating enzyme
MLDYIIVGQGIAGTCLAIRLINAGKRICILDNGYRNSSSIVAAGIINPITGRKYNKSWMADELIREVETFYFQLQEEWGIDFIRKTSVIRTFHNANGENSWYDRMGSPIYNNYISQNATLGAFEEMINTPFGFGEVLKAYQMDLPLFLNAFSSKNDHLLEHQEFDFDLLKVDNNSISYNGIKALNIVFAEGYQVINNRYFDYLPFQPAKGEALIIRIEGMIPNKILRDKMFICPLGKDLYWVGSGYDWEILDEQPTEKHLNKMEAFLDSILRVPYKIVSHKAGVRPSTIDRRPILGRHPKYPNVFIFNGMGTKGTSLSPYWSKHMADFMIDDVQLPEEVHISRFQ